MSPLSDYEQRMMNDRGPVGDAFRAGALCEAREREATTVAHRHLVDYTRALAEHHPDWPTARIVTVLVAVWGSVVVAPTPDAVAPATETAGGEERDAHDDGDDAEGEQDAGQVQQRRENDQDDPENNHGHSVPPTYRQEPEMTADWSDRHASTQHIMRYLRPNRRLPAHLYSVSAACNDLAQVILANVPDGAELSAGMRYLLIAKDHFVRAAMTEEDHAANDPDQGLSEGGRHAR